MIRRIIVALFGIPIILFVVLSRICHSLPFLLFLILFNALAINEIHHIFSLKKINVNKIYFITCGTLMILSLYIKLMYIQLLPLQGSLTYKISEHLYGLIFILSVSIYFISMIFKNNYKDIIPKISCLTFGLFYIPYLSGYFLLLKTMT